MSLLSFENVSKSYMIKRSNTRIEILSKFNLKIKNDEFICFFGPNGCGKTTILNLISGLIPPDNGQIVVHSGDNVKISYIFQNFNDTILPWRNCLDNLSYPLEVSGLTKKESRETVYKYFNENNIQFNLSRYPYQLSGGQKQLLVLYRALIYQPDIFLLDEPFSSLDYDIRIEMEIVLLKILEKRKTTTVFVSHEIDEAIFLSDRICILSQAPINILADVNINFPKPRDINIMKSKEFNNIRNEIITIFQKGVS